MSDYWDTGDPATLIKKFSVLLNAVHAVEASESEQDAIEAVVLSVSDLGYPNVMISLLLENERPNVIRAVSTLGEEWESIADITVRLYPGPDLLARVLERGEAKFCPDSRKDEENDPIAIKKSGIITQYVIPLLTEDMRIGTMQIHMGQCATKPELQCRMLDALGTHLSIAISRFRALQQLRRADAQMLSHTRSAIANEVAATILHQLKGEVGKFRQGVEEMLQDKQKRENAIVYAVLTTLKKQVLTWWAKIDAPLHFIGVDESLHTCSASEIVTDTLAFWYENAKARKCSIKRVERAGDVRVHIWPSHLKELLSCLILNALQAHARTIKVALDRRPEHCGQEDKQMCAVLTVTDDGDGIRKETANRLFDLGFTTKPKEGTGMGLYIARRLANAMCGYIELASGGKSSGATKTVFRLVLPAED